MECTLSAEHHSIKENAMDASEWRNSEHPAARALCVLLPQCDGAVHLDNCGLNKYDASSYLRYGIDDLDRWAGRLVKYHRQIGKPLADECQEVAKQYEERVKKGIFIIRSHPSGRFVIPLSFKDKDKAKTAAEVACGRRVLCWNHQDAQNLWSVTPHVVRQLVASGKFVTASDVDLSALPEPKVQKPPAQAQEPVRTSADFRHTPEMTPRSYQAEGIDAILYALSKCNAAILADEMGLGKTLQGLGSSFALGTKVLVLCPAGARLVWATETLKATADKTVYIYKHGMSDKRKKEFFGENTHRVLEDSGAADVLVVSYAGARNLVVDNEDSDTNRFHTMKKVPTERFARWLSRAIVIADEAQAMKNPRAKRSQAAYAIIRAAKYKIPMTGTPITNRPEEFWGMLCAAGLHREVAKTKSEFYDRYVFGCEHENLHEKLVASPWWIRRLKKDVEKDLPDKIRGDIKVEMSEALYERYAAARNLVASGNPAVMLKGLTEMQTIANEAKVDPLVELLEERVDAEQPTVVQSTRTAPLFQIRDKLSKKGIRAETLTGEDNDYSRGKKIKEFQNGEYDVILTTLRESITLTRSAHMILLDVDWSPAAINQREDRIHRISQTQTVTIQRVIAASIDEHKIRVVCAKQDVISAIVDGGRNTWDEDQAIQEVIIRIRKEAA
ncbi:MAG: hypothetical protein GF334_08755 [Candidatus Altiarchaeales archaeon]|nr:hypothetical protein [Candidatus Altiarchaeales archaeon]